MTAPVTPINQTPSAGAPYAKPVNLALQGGGSHGAFAWGVLDALLEDGRMSFEAISATSAGAVNAAAMAYGLSVAGSEGARQKLHDVWQAVSKASNPFKLAHNNPWEPWLRASGLPFDNGLAIQMMQTMTQLFSPYQLNPLNINPLRQVLVETIDFEQLQRCSRAPRLYISATNVRTGKIKIFENAQLSADSVLASACLPHIFQAVEIDGEHYWDGGFMGNPAIYPLIYRTGTRDVVIVHINPLERSKLPTSSAEIIDRMNEISFNSSLMREMRAIAFVTKLIDDKALDAKTYSRMLIHSIGDQREMERLGQATKLNADWEFLLRLRDDGRKSAQRWLDRNLDQVGLRSTTNISETYL